MEFNYNPESAPDPEYIEKRHYLDVLEEFGDMMPRVTVTIRLDRIGSNDYAVMKSLFSAVSMEYRRIISNRLKKRRDKK